jgi:hypothetical protein
MPTFFAMYSKYPARGFCVSAAWYSGATTMRRMNVAVSCGR